MNLLSAALAIALSVAGHSHFEKRVSLNPLDAIERFESGGRNVKNYRYDPTHTAAGHFQITNTTWKSIAPKAGIDLDEYPTAMSAPYHVQRKAAAALYNRGGFSDWEPYNPSLRAHIAENGRNAFVKPGALSADGGPAGKKPILPDLLGEDDEDDEGGSFLPPTAKKDGSGGGTSGAPAAPSFAPFSLANVLKAINEPPKDEEHAAMKNLMADMLAESGVVPKDFPEKMGGTVYV